MTTSGTLKPNKPTLVFIHGVGLDTSMWDGVIDILSNDFYCAAIPMPGHEGKPAASGIDDYIKNIADEISFISSRPVVVIGYSMGGMVAAGLAASYPDIVSKLVMMNAVHVRSPKARAAVIERLDVASVNGLNAVVEAAIPRWFSHEFMAANPVIIENIKRVLMTNDLDAYLAAYRVFATSDQDIAQRLQDIECPVMAMTGVGDVNSTPEMSHAIANNVRDGRAVILDGLAHGAPIEAPDQVADKIKSFVREGE